MKKKSRSPKPKIDFGIQDIKRPTKTIFKMSPYRRREKQQNAKLGVWSTKLTPFLEVYLCFLTFLIPFLWFLYDWLWAVWFLDFAILPASPQQKTIITRLITKIETLPYGSWKTILPTAEKFHNYKESRWQQKPRQQISSKHNPRQVSDESRGLCSEILHSGRMCWPQVEERRLESTKNNRSCANLMGVERVGSERCSGDGERERMVAAPNPK